MRAPRAPMATVAASISSSAPAPRASPLHRTSSGAARPRAKAVRAGAASAMCAERSSTRHAASVGRSAMRRATSSASRTPDSRVEGSAKGGACVIGPVHAQHPRAEPVELRHTHAAVTTKCHVRRNGARCRRHCPQHARRRPAHQHAVHRERHPGLGLAVSATPQQSGGGKRTVDVGRVNLRACQRDAPPQPQPHRRLAAALPRRLQREPSRTQLHTDRGERRVERRGVGHVAAPLPRRQQPEWPPSCRARRRPLPAAVHRRRRLATAAAHLKRAALEQRALHPRRATRLQRQRLQEEHAAQRRARRRGRNHGEACRSRRLKVSRTREDDAPAHDVVGHKRMQRASHGRTK
eukprot:scaffold15817_cov70-Phaeocystis_antarctica.AAC.7